MKLIIRRCISNIVFGGEICLKVPKKYKINSEFLLLTHLVDEQVVRLSKGSIAPPAVVRLRQGPHL